MKYQYEFADGEVCKIEVDEYWAGVLADLDRMEYNNDKKETRRHCTLDVLGDEGAWMIDESADPYKFVPEKLETESRTNKAMSKLSESQRDVLVAVGYTGMSLTEYAQNKGIDHSTASRNYQRAKNNFKKFF